MWGAQRWPSLVSMIGGLIYIAPIHTLIAWLFASFIVMHVYLTTTGYKPVTAVKAMMMGWEEVEVSSEDTHDQEIEQLAEQQKTEGADITPKIDKKTRVESNNNGETHLEQDPGADDDPDAKEVGKL